MIKLKETLLLLARSNVDFVIVGGVAATLQGSAFQTFDLDVCYSRVPENFERLVSAPFPYRPMLRGAPPGVPRQRGLQHPRRIGFRFHSREQLLRDPLGPLLPRSRALRRCDQVREIPSDRKGSAHRTTAAETALPTGFAPTPPPKA